MKSTVETLSPTRVRLDIEVPFAELEQSLKKAYRQISSQVNIPGFRRGKVPPAILDQRVGRATILSEAVNEAIPAQLVAAVQEHKVRTLGTPTVSITELNDGSLLRFSAEVDVRPEITLPDLSKIEVTVDAVEVSDEEVDRELSNLRVRFASLKTADRPARRGDFVQLDLAATVDGHEVEGGTASNYSHELGSGTLLPGLDEAVEGLRAAESTVFGTRLVGGEYEGRTAEVNLTVRSVKERELPEADDDFAQLASEFDTLAELRSDLTDRVRRHKKSHQIFQARDKVLEVLREEADVPAPEGVVADAVDSRRKAMSEELERVGATMADLLSERGLTEEDFTAELTTAAQTDASTQLLLDAFAEAERLDVTEEEYGREVIQRAGHAGMDPQAYHDRLVQAGLASSVLADVRRGKALTAILERVSIRDSEGRAVSVDDLPDDEDHTDRD